MSRTYKDAPYRVKQLKKMKDGYSSHDFCHHYRNTSFSGDRVYTKIEEVVFEKKDSAAIVDYQRRLDEEGYSYEMEEKPSRPLYKSYFDARIREYRHRLIGYAPKQIVFRIEVVREVSSRMSDECVNVENYDPSNGRDKRNGKFASCVPDVYLYDKKEYRGGYNYDSTTPMRYSKIRRKANFSKIANAFNRMGEDYEELMDDDGFVEDAVIYADIEGKLWDW